MKVKFQNQILTQNARTHNKELQSKAESTFMKNRGTLQKLIKRNWIHPEWLMFLSLNYITDKSKMRYIIDGVVEHLEDKFKIEVSDTKRLYSEIEKLALLSVARPNHSTFNMKTHRKEGKRKEVSFQMSRLSKPIKDFPVICEFDLEARISQIVQTNSLSLDPLVMDFKTGGFRKPNGKFFDI